MTILIGAVFPWFDLKKWPAFNVHQLIGLPMGAIIAADSRWTLASGSHEDGAVKVFAVSRNTIAGYSGSVSLGEDVLTALSRGLTKTKTMDEFARQAQRIIADRFNTDINGHDSFAILLGFSNRAGYGWLAEFRPDDGFEPHEVKDVAVIGSEKACLYLSQSLRAATHFNMGRTGESLNVDINTWASLVGALVDETCELVDDDSIAGPITCLRTSRGEIKSVGITKVQRLKDRLVARDVTLDAVASRTLRRHWKSTRGFDEEPTS